MDQQSQKRKKVKLGETPIKVCVKYTTTTRGASEKVDYFFVQNHISLSFDEVEYDYI